MAQFARPDSDLVTGGWGAPVYSKVNEVTPDATYAIGPNKSDGTCELSLSSVIDPASSGGHVLRCRAYIVGTFPTGINLYFQLLQGTTLIKQWTPTLTTSGADYTYTLTSGEADSITNYADLRVKFVQDYITGSTGRGYVSWFELEVPDAQNQNIDETASAARSNALAVSDNVVLLADATMPAFYDVVTVASLQAVDEVSQVRMDGFVVDANIVCEETLYDIA